MATSEVRATCARIVACAREQEEGMSPIAGINLVHASPNAPAVWRVKFPAVDASALNIQRFSGDEAPTFASRAAAEAALATECGFPMSLLRRREPPQAPSPTAAAVTQREIMAEGKRGAAEAGGDAAPPHTPLSLPKQPPPRRKARAGGGTVPPAEWAVARQELQEELRKLVVDAPRWVAGTSRYVGLDLVDGVNEGGSPERLWRVDVSALKLSDEFAGGKMEAEALIEHALASAGLDNSTLHRRMWTAKAENEAVAAAWAASLAAGGGAPPAQAAGVKRARERGGAVGGASTAAAASTAQHGAAAGTRTHRSVAGASAAASTKPPTALPRHAPQPPRTAANSTLTLEARTQLATELAADVARRGALRELARAAGDSALRGVYGSAIDALGRGIDAAIASLGE